MEENVNEVKFVGQPPFILPEARSAQADVFEKSVVITLFSVVEGLDCCANEPRCCAGSGHPANAYRLGR
jgi:hypothetical protein